MNNKTMSDLQDFQNSLGIKFDDENLLKRAFIHRSYLNEHPNLKLEHNERLEFLGDAVVELIITDYLYKNFKDPEGKLTSWRAALVNSDMMSEISERIKIGDFLMLSRGEARDTERARQYILADALEALIGALYLDRGYQECEKFVHKYIIPELPKIIAEKKYMDDKSYFQEKAQEETGITPCYQVLKEWGPDHARHFGVGVFLKEDLIGEGEGLSKQEAEQKAAGKALAKMGWDKKE